MPATPSVTRATRRVVRRHRQRRWAYEGGGYGWLALSSGAAYLRVQVSQQLPDCHHLRLKRSRSLGARNSCLQTAPARTQGHTSAGTGEIRPCGGCNTSTPGTEHAPPRRVAIGADQAAVTGQRKVRRGNPVQRRCVVGSRLQHARPQLHRRVVLLKPRVHQRVRRHVLDAVRAQLQGTCRRLCRGEEVQ